MEDILAKIKELLNKLIAFVKDLIAKLTGNKPADTEETTGA